MIVLNSKFLPTVAEIRAVVADYRDGRARSGVEAWGDVIKLTRRHRDVGDMEGVDPVVYSICERFDWIVHRDLWHGGETIKQWKVSMPEHENITSARARFCELYDNLAARDQEDRQIAGALPAPPTQFADPARALVAALQRKLTSGNKDGR